MKYDSGRELIARAIIVRDGAVLVNRARNKKTGQDYYALPGGHVDPGESCVAALHREIQEELEVAVTVGDLRFVAEQIYAGRKPADGPRHELVLFFEAHLAGKLPQRDGAILSPEKSKHFVWLPLRELPGANLLPATGKQFLLAPGGSLYAFDDATQR